MGFMTWFLIATVLFFVVGYTLKVFSLLSKYKTAAEQSAVRGYDGIVSDMREEKKYRGEPYTLCYPIYQWVIDGKMLVCQSNVQQMNVSLGQSVALCYDKATGELWAAEDVPMMKTQLKLWLIRAAIMIIVLIVVEIAF